MTMLHRGYCSYACGIARYRNDVAEQPKLIQIRLKHEAPDNLVEPCGLPANAKLDLKVTPISGCSGFEPARTPNA